MTNSTGALVEAMRARRIDAMPATAIEGWHGVSVAMYVDQLERFLDTIIRRPLSEADRLAMRIIGRAQDLDQSDEPWRYDLVPSVSDSTDLIRMRAFVSIPEQDVDEVLARLIDPDPID